MKMGSKQRFEIHTKYLSRHLGLQVFFWLQKKKQKKVNLKVRTNLVLDFFSPEPKAELMANMSPRISFTVSTVSFILTFSLKFGSQDATAMKVLLQCEEAWLDPRLITGQASSEPGKCWWQFFCTSESINQDRAGLIPLQTKAREGKDLLVTDLFLFLISEGHTWRYSNIFMLFSYMLCIMKLSI